MPQFLMPSSKDSPQSGALTAEDIIALRLGFKIPHEFQVGPLCFTPSVQRNSSQTTEARKKVKVSGRESGTIVWREVNWSQKRRASGTRCDLCSKHFMVAEYFRGQVGKCGNSTNRIALDSENPESTILNRGIILDPPQDELFHKTNAKSNPVHLRWKYSIYWHVICSSCRSDTELLDHFTKRLPENQEWALMIVRYSRVEVTMILKAWDDTVDGRNPAPVDR